MHHSLIDGAGSQSFMHALHDLEPVPTTAFAAKALERAKDYAPATLAPARLLRKALTNTVSSNVGLIKGAVKLGGGLVRTAWDIRAKNCPLIRRRQNVALTNPSAHTGSSTRACSAWMISRRYGTLPVPR